MSGESVSLRVESVRPGTRLDAYLRIRFPDVSRSTLRRLIDAGEIRVDGQAVKPASSVRAGQQITIHWPAPQPAEALPEAIPLAVLFEDADLLVVNKEAGLVVHPAAGNEQHTLVNALLHHCQGQLSGVGGVARPGIVHRLDKDTSGCLVVAKNDFAHVGLAEQFAGRRVEKIYLALVCGEVRREGGELRAAIARHPSHRKRMAVTEGQGRAAWTSYRVLERWAGVTLVEAQLHTGRTHQIRVHFEHLGYPLVGDATYGKRANQRLTEVTGYAAPRQMLHARRLAFDHPRSGERLRFEAPWPEDFLAARTRFAGGPRA